MDAIPVPDPAADLIRTFLATVYGPERDFEAHFGCYSSEALLLVGPRVFRRRQLTAAEYAERLDETARILDQAAAGQDSRGFDLVAAHEARVGEQEASVRVTLAGRATGREFPAVFVFRDDGLMGAAVLEREDLPEPAVALALVCAEFAELPPPEGPADLFLNGLELSFSRVFATEPVALRYLPEARFSCARCGESCRIGKWDVRVSEATRVAVEAMPWDRLWPDLPAGGHFRAHGALAGSPLAEPFTFARKQDGVTCVFHDAGVGCVIHSVVGRAPVPVCQKFPYMFTLTPDGVDVWTSFHCHAALYGTGTPLAEREADIRSRFRVGRRHVWQTGDAPPLGYQGRPVAWDTYRAIEQALLDLLDPVDERPLEPRLHAGDTFLLRLADLDPGTEITRELVGQFGAAREAAPGQESVRAGSEDDLAVDLLCLLIGWPLPADEQSAFLDGRFQTLYAALADTPFEWKPPARLVATYLRRCLFHKIFLRDGGILFSWRYVLLTWATLRLYTRLLAYLEAETARERGVAAAALPRAPLGAAGSAIPGLELPTIPDGVSERSRLVPHVQKAIMDLEMLVVHYHDLFSRAFLAAEGERRRLLARETGAALIWG
ncbi:MAG: hypothetical protein FJZ01_25565 [Candidatus Sericytochromatia bacterium]|nr:hypothetical protein [Candidatus Tanganyikabacteria bacterium]